ncbi:MAG TPA: AMP-binding protein, partial [Gaiellaceae bacterium]|nr:AMP-binding protein [Gaiellaceae bacterium]
MPIPSASSRCRSRTAFASTPPREPGGRRRSSRTRALTSRPGRTAAPGRWRRRAPAPAPSSTSRTATACSPAASASTTAPSVSAARSSPGRRGNTPRHAQLLEDLGAEILCCTPSYALAIADHVSEPARLNLRAGVFGAEPWTEGLREAIEHALQLTAVDIYGLSEVMGPGVSAECLEGRNGAHVNEDHFLVEVVDPASGEPLPDRELGELVFSTLTKEALPLLRYRTGDLASLTREPCACGRTFARMSRIVGRTDDMLIIRGVNVFPSEIER